MLASTFLALRTQGVSAGELRRTAKVNFNVRANRMVDGLPDNATQAFWAEMISARRAYRRKTGHNIEDVLSA
jgi:hypothetical protein